VLRVGLSGGIGSGKSAVAARLAALGAAVIDADVIAREVVEPGTEGLAAVTDAFGEGILDERGGLDRTALASVVFADEAARARLSGILHPRIAARTGDRVAGVPSDAILVHDVPLLVEGGLAAGYHLVLMVGAPEGVRVERLVRDRGMSAEEARSRMRAQAGEDARREVTDVWLDNGGAPAATEVAVDALWGERLVPYETNVRNARPAPRAATEPVGPDPSWPEQGRRIVARLGAALGDRAARIEHVGPTSLADAPARDVLDVELEVAALQDTSAVVEPLAAAGFPRVAGHARDRRSAEHRNADPGRAVDVHVRAPGDASGGAT
jgi:dephospho-CoA kinase